MQFEFGVKIMFGFPLVVYVIIGLFHFIFIATQQYCVVECVYAVCYYTAKTQILEMSVDGRRNVLMKY